MQLATSDAKYPRGFKPRATLRDVRLAALPLGGNASKDTASTIRTVRARVCPVNQSGRSINVEQRRAHVLCARMRKIPKETVVKIAKLN